MNWQKLIKSKVVTATKLGNRVVTGLIESIDTTDMKDPSSQQINSVILCKISGEDVPFRMNITNLKSLSKAWGEEIEKWIGKKVKIFVVDRQTPSGPGKGLEFEAISKK